MNIVKHLYFETLPWLISCHKALISSQNFLLFKSFFFVENKIVINKSPLLPTMWKGAWESLLAYFEFCQIWLNIFMDDHHHLNNIIIFWEKTWGLKWESHLMWKRLSLNVTKFSNFVKLTHKMLTNIHYHVTNYVTIGVYRILKKVRSMIT
jgi:hypothetical protein